MTEQSLADAIKITSMAGIWEGLRITGATDAEIAAVMRDSGMTEAEIEQIKTEASR